MKVAILKKNVNSYDSYFLYAYNNNKFTLLGWFLSNLFLEKFVQDRISWLKGDDSHNPDTEDFYIDLEDGTCSIWCRFNENEDGYCPEDMRYFLTEKNMMHVLQEWKKAMMFQPNHIVLQEDDSGWVDLYMKEKLSDEEAKDCEENPSFFTFD